MPSPCVILIQQASTEEEYRRDTKPIVMETVCYIVGAVLFNENDEVDQSYLLVFSQLEKSTFDTQISNLQSFSTIRTSLIRVTVLVLSYLEKITLELKGADDAGV